jgi:sugar transferase (PEP-CTERM system associated)
MESATLVVAFLIAVFIRFEHLGYENLLAKALLSALVLQLCIYYSDLYEESALRWRVELFLRLGQAFAIGAILLSIIFYTIPALTVGRGVLAIYFMLGLPAVFLWRGVFPWMAGREALVDRVLVLGTGPSAQQIALEMLHRAALGFRVVGFVGESEAEVGRSLLNPSVVGTTRDLVPLVQRHRVNLIVVALEDRRGKMAVADLLRCRMAGVRVEEVSSFFERLTGKILVKNLRPSWLVFSHGFNKPRLLKNSKRVCDFLLAAVLLLLLGPVMLVVALLVKLTSLGPVLYRQKRVGEKGHPFVLLKFRTMRSDAEAATGPVWATEDSDPRITPLGRLLRKTRLDELPQVLNVLRGEMSFIGPRPERPHFVESLRQVIPYYDERHAVKPGITGWAQIKFGYGSTLEDAEEKLQYDLYYIKHMSLAFDLGIVFDTVKVMVVGKGAR